MDKKKNKNLEKSESSCCGPSQASCCTPSQTSCCGASDSIDSLEHANQITSSDITQQESTSQKLKVDIYVPLEACSCEWSQFMNLIFAAMTPYIKYLDHETKSLNSEEARELKLSGNCVIIDGKKKYTTSHALKKDLPSLLKEKGLI